MTVPTSADVEAGGKQMATPSPSSVLEMGGRRHHSTASSSVSFFTEGRLTQRKHDDSTTTLRHNTVHQQHRNNNDNNNNNNDDTTIQQQQQVVLFGQDLSHLSANTQFAICTAGVFLFNVLYGYLQELLQVHIAGRKFALFLAVCQFAGYAFWAEVLARLNKWNLGTSRELRSTTTTTGGGESSSPIENGTTTSTIHDGTNNNNHQTIGNHHHHHSAKGKKRFTTTTTTASTATTAKFIGLSLLRAFDLAVTNSAMQYLNYPAKTLIKSCRVVFTMLLGVLIRRKRYKSSDYIAVFTLVVGLVIFLHADSTSDAVFHPMGVLLLTISLLCDGTLNNWSEQMMEEYNLSQDEFHSRLYLVSLIATMVAAFLRNELLEGIDSFLLQDGTVPEIESLTTTTTTITATQKAFLLVLFGTTGIMGASCLGAITKRFGALSMALTSTGRKATTLFLSFAVFDENRCTPEHAAGISLFMGGLLLKSFAKKTTTTTVRTRNDRGTTTQDAGEAPEQSSSSSTSVIVGTHTSIGSRWSMWWMATMERAVRGGKKNPHDLYNGKSFSPDRKILPSRESSIDMGLAIEGD